jgi:hypothetical protein
MTIMFKLKIVWILEDCTWILLKIFISEFDMTKLINDKQLMAWFVFIIIFKYLKYQIFYIFHINNIYYTFYSS